MSIHIMALVWERAPYDGGTLLVLLALADWANEEGVTWPSMAQLASKARMQIRNTQYILRALEADGMLTREQHGSGRATTVYRINMVRLGHLPVIWKRPPDTPSMTVWEQKENTAEYAPMQNLHDALHCTPVVHSIAPLPSNDCTPALHPIAPQGCTPLRQNRHGTANEPSSPPTPPADAGGAGFSPSGGSGAGENLAPPSYPSSPTPSPLTSPPDRDRQEGQGTPPALTRDDIRAFMATLWREYGETDTGPNGTPAAPPPTHGPAP